jgi:hypothetical protein
MNDLNELEHKLRVKLALVTEKRQAAEETSERTTEASDLRLDAYKRAAQQLMAGVLRPRLEKVMTFFPNALLSPAEADTESQWCCRFQKTAEYPASMKLSFFVSPDAEVENAIVTYRLEILPIYFQFEGNDQFVVPLDGVQAASLADWVDAKLLGFVDAYVRTQTVKQYQLSVPFTEPSSNLRLQPNAVVAATGITPEMAREVVMMGDSESSWDADELQVGPNRMKDELAAK